MAFYPDHSGIALYSSDFAFYAAEKGHEVSVVTGFPFYPSWRKRPEDKRRLFRKDTHKNIKIYRGYLYVPSRPTGLRRILQEISFLFFAFINFFKAGKQDVIVVFTTPVLLGVLGWMFKKIYGSVLVINVQDFQVEAADSLGMLRMVPVVPLMLFLEKFSYKRSDVVTSISTSMTKLLHEKGLPESSTYLWPNWIEVEKASATGQPGNFRKKFGIRDEEIIIGYAGNVGNKQGLNVLIDLANAYKGTKDLLFLIIGEGSDLANLKQYHADHPTDNLRFLPFLNPAGYADFLADADVIFIAQKKIPKDIYFPSKLLGLMAASKLIFLAADEESELYKVLLHNELSLVSRFENFDELKQCVDKILTKDKILDKFKTNAWTFVQQFDRETVLDQALKKIEIIKKSAQ